MDSSDFDLEYQNNYIDSKIIACLDRITQSFRVILWQQSKELCLTPTQIQVLIFLLHHKEEMRRVSYLAIEFNMSKATISDTVKTLDQKGLISKNFRGSDARSHTIDLTSKGEEIAIKTSLFTKQLRKPIEQLGFEGKDNLLSGLLHIISELNKSGIVNTQRMCFTCTYYRTEDNGEKHYCKLLNLPLQAKDLRIDCAEHQIS